MPRATRAAEPPAGMRVQDPPVPDSPDWQAAADWCRSHQMVWLLLYESGRTTWLSAARQGKVLAVRPRLGFEFKSANNTHPTDEPRTCDGYMRYNPALEEEE